MDHFIPTVTSNWSPSDFKVTQSHLHLPKVTASHPKTTTKWRKNVSKCPRSDPKVTIMRQKWPQNDSRVIAKWSKVTSYAPSDPKVVPNCPESVPKVSQSSPKVLQMWPKVTLISSNWPQSETKTTQMWPLSDPEVTKSHRHMPKVVPKWPKVTFICLRWAQTDAKLTPK